MKALRVLFVSGSFPPMRCGIGDYTARLAAALADADTTVAVLTGRAASPHPCLEVLAVAETWSFAEALALSRLSKAWRPDIVHFQFPTQGFGQRYMPYLLPLAIRRQGIAVVETWHEYQRWLMPRYVPNAWIDGGLIAVRPNYHLNMAWWTRLLTAHKHFRFIPNASVIPTAEMDAARRAAVRNRHAPAGKSLVVYFGFVYPPKGVDQLFEIVDPEMDHLILASDLSATDAFTSHIAATAMASRDRVTVTGFLPPIDLAELLAAADAVVLPFREGGGMWNTSIHAAIAQGTFLLTTASDQHGFDPSTNVYWANPGDVNEMRTALRLHIGNRVEPNRSADEQWTMIAAAHVDLYRCVIGGRS